MTDEHMKLIWSFGKNLSFLVLFLKATSDFTVTHNFDKIKSQMNYQSHPPAPYLMSHHETE